MRQLETIQRLEKQLEAAKQGAIGELLEERKKKLAEVAALDAELGRLGHASKSRGRRAGGQRVCGTCGELGHNSRSCVKNTEQKVTKRVVKSTAPAQ